MLSHRIVTVRQRECAVPPKATDGAGKLDADMAPNLALPWVLRLRYGMAAGEAAIVLGMAYGFRLQLPLLWTFAPLFLVLVSNIVLSRLRVLPCRFPQETLGAVFCLDTLCLTALLGLTGGPMNPFSLLYLVQITLSSVVLRKSWTWALEVLSTACFGLLFFFHSPLAALQTHHLEQGLSPHLVGMWIAFVIAAALITFFTGKIADALRTREQEVLSLAGTVAKNERLASLVTLAAGAAHELGTPLATIAVVAKELERYTAHLTGADSVLEDARLIRSEVERCRRILERMSVQSAEPMGETPNRVRCAIFLLHVSAQFPEPQRALLRIELADESLDRCSAGASYGPVARGADPECLGCQPGAASRCDRGRRARNRNCGSPFGTTAHGMPANVLRRIAEPFFTTKEPGKGMGLGTFLVRTFAESLGGRVAVRFDSRRRHDRDAGTAHALIGTERSCRRLKNCLWRSIVDDDEVFRDRLCRALAQRNWEADAVSGGRRGTAVRPRAQP